jgi:hypothetical protein
MVSINSLYQDFFSSLIHSILNEHNLFISTKLLSLIRELSATLLDTINTRIFHRNICFLIFYLLMKFAIHGVCTNWTRTKPRNKH